MSCADNVENRTNPAPMLFFRTVSIHLILVCDFVIPVLRLFSLDVVAAQALGRQQNSIEDSRSALKKLKGLTSDVRCVAQCV